MAASGVLYCVSDPDREGEFEVGFTTAHIDRVIHRPGAGERGGTRCLEFAKATSAGHPPIDAIVAVLARYGRRVASHPNIYIFSNVERAQIHEFFNIARGAWVEVIPPAIDTGPSESEIDLFGEVASAVSQSDCGSPTKGGPETRALGMAHTFRHGQTVRHVLKAVGQTKTRPANIGSALTAVYCANLRRLVCEAFPGGRRAFTSVSGFALANLRLAKRSRAVNGWAHCEALAPDGAWVPLAEIRGRLGDRGGESP